MMARISSSSIAPSCEPSHAGVFSTTWCFPLLVPVHQMLTHRMDSSEPPYEISDLRTSVPAGEA